MARIKKSLKPVTVVFQESGEVKAYCHRDHRSKKTRVQFYKNKKRMNRKYKKRLEDIKLENLTSLQDL